MCVLSAEIDEILVHSPIPQIPPLRPDETSLVAEFCDYATLLTLSQVARDPRAVSKPLLDRLDTETERLEEYLNYSPYRHYCDTPGWEWRSFFEEFDARREIRHYLNGFEGHIDFFAADAVLQFTKHQQSIPKQTIIFIRQFLDDLRRHQLCFQWTLLPLHRRFALGTFTENQLIVFDAFIALKEQTKKLCQMQEESNWATLARKAEYKLFVEQIGVMIGYPTLKEMQWITRKKHFERYVELRRARGLAWTVMKKAFDDWKDFLEFGGTMTPLVRVLKDFTEKYRSLTVDGSINGYSVRNDD